MSPKILLIAGALALSATGPSVAQEALHFINCGSPTDPTAAVQTKDIEAWLAENPGYTVNEEYVPWGQCQEKAITLASAGTPAALAYLGSRTLPQLSEADLILPFDLTEDQKASYAPSILRTVVFNDEIWGLPRAFSSKALFYNKDLFEQAGLDMPEGPQTFSDVVAAAKAISENTDAAGIGIPAASFDNTMHQFLSWMYSNGGEVVNADGEVMFDSPEVVETLKLYADLAPYAQEGPVAYDRAELEPLFQNGQIAMMIHGYSFKKRVGDANFAIAPVPNGPSGEHSTLLITDSLAVFKGSGQEEAAMSLAKFLTETELQANFDDAGGWTPIRDTETTRKLIASDPDWAFFIDTVPEGGPEPQMADYVGQQDVLNEAIQGVVLGEITPEEAAQEAADDLRDLQE